MCDVLYCIEDKRKSQQTEVAQDTYTANNNKWYYYSYMYAHTFPRMDSFHVKIHSKQVRHTQKRRYAMTAILEIHPVHTLGFPERMRSIRCSILSAFCNDIDRGTVVVLLCRHSMHLLFGHIRPSPAYRLHPNESYFHTYECRIVCMIALLVGLDLYNDATHSYNSNNMKYKQQVI